MSYKGDSLAGLFTLRFPDRASARRCLETGDTSGALPQYERIETEKGPVLRQSAAWATAPFEVVLKWGKDAGVTKGA